VHDIRGRIRPGATEVEGAAIRTTAGQAFADLQKGIRQCFVDYALVFEPRTGK
jgi:hypothetical protein